MKRNLFFLLHNEKKYLDNDNDTSSALSLPSSPVMSLSLPDSLSLSPLPSSQPQFPLLFNENLNQDPSPNSENLFETNQDKAYYDEIFFLDASDPFPTTKTLEHCEEINYQESNFPFNPEYKKENHKLDFLPRSTLDEIETFVKQPLNVRFNTQMKCQVLKNRDYAKTQMDCIKPSFDLCHSSFFSSFSPPSSSTTMRNCYPIDGAHLDIMNGNYEKENEVCFIKNCNLQKTTLLKNTMMWEKRQKHEIELNDEENSKEQTKKQEKQEKKKSRKENRIVLPIEKKISCEQNIFYLKTPLNPSQRKCYDNESRHCKPNTLIISAKKRVKERLSGFVNINLVYLDYSNVESPAIDIVRVQESIDNNTCYFKSLKFKAMSSVNRFMLKFTIHFKDQSRDNSEFQREIIYSNPFDICARPKSKKKINKM